LLADALDYRCGLGDERGEVVHEGNCRGRPAAEMSIAAHTWVLIALAVRIGAVYHGR
jgi:hypothetical protein